jgi:hypothetical protein
MAEFDVAQPWVIIIEDGSLRAAAGELSGYIEKLRAEAGVKQQPPLVLETGSTGVDSASVESAPLIVLRADVGAAVDGGGGFSWRLDRERLEITGASARGLCNGVFDFAANLGFRWQPPARGSVREELPSKLRLHKTARRVCWELTENYGYGDSARDVREWRRLVFDRRSARKWEAWLHWAARSRIDALVLPLCLKPSARLYARIAAAAKKYGLAIEAGGRDLRLFVPRRLFLFHPALFRMTDGRRNKDANFCATSSETIAVLSKNAKKIFASRPSTTVFHLWTDVPALEGGAKSASSAWCACPSCRAFTPDEQNRIAVNAAAKVLAAVNPAAFISFYEPSSDRNDIALRPNLFKVSRLPEKAGVEAGGWVFAD